jgi:hypothetical protein
MAMGRRTRDEAERAIRNCRPFQNSTGSMWGTRGSTRGLGWLSNHREANQIKELLSRATYVVWSYSTPIGCVTEDDDGNITKFYFDEYHTTTTSHHQGVLRVAFSDFETVGTGPWSRSHGRGDGPVRSRPQTASVQELGGRMATNHRGVQYDPRVERDTSWERDMAEARRQAAPVNSPGYQLGRTETEQEGTFRRLLDPRYADPDWVPNRDREADWVAEERDAARVEREGSWRP